MKVYISGQTNFRENAEQDYKQAQLLLESKGHEVENPFECSTFIDATIEHQFRVRISLLIGVEAIFLLPGWAKSKESQIEYQIAHELKMRLVNSESPDWEEYLK